MKARSLVFETAQKPMMIYGLPSRFTVLVVGSAFILLQLVPSLIGGSFHKIALLSMFVVLPGLVVWCWKLGRKDWHIDSLMVCFSLFWPIRSKERWFLCGHPPPGHKAKKRRT